jgi:hypothetical protein
MKSSMILPLLAIVAFKGVEAGWQATRTVPRDDRRLESTFGFLVSNIDNAKYGTEWCIQAPEDDSDNSKLDFEPCFFYWDSRDYKLWKFEDLKFRNKANPNLCITIKSLFDGARVRVADCDEETDLNLFLHDGLGTTGSIIVKKDEEFCLTNRGTKTHHSDPIIVKECRKKGRFHFSHQPEPDQRDYYGFVNDDACGDDYYFPGGCLVVEDEIPLAGQPIILGSCDFNHNWHDDGDSLFHTQLDHRMCMQAGPDGETPGLGTEIFLFPCDKDNELQKFYYDGVDISLGGLQQLCIGFPGQTGELGEPIVLTTCENNDNGNNWSND